eukprot:jgi/Mesen1/4393/ME000223S03466
MIITSEETEVAKVVVIDYFELLDEDANLTDKISAGFGECGLGIVSVANVPGYAALRQKLLPLASRLADLPDDAKRRIEDPSCSYNLGWSHGKERLENGRFDVRKGSFYANPLHNVPTTDEALMKRYPSFCRPNLWPSQDLPELEPAFRELSELIIRVGFLLTRHCDSYVKRRNPEATAGRLSAAFERSRAFKGRLLHYFPASSSSSSSQEGSADDSAWCGWHTDFGSLTGLTSAMYMRGSEEVPNPDSRSGLFIRTRQGSLYKAAFPADHIAFQTGQALQIHSGGALQATPHCVRAAQGPDAVGVSRNTFALFMQGVDQWEPGLEFGAFTEKINVQIYDKADRS